MSENKYTPEPWAYGEDNDGWHVEKDVIQIAHGLTEEDARRIVSCVNACAGCATDVLETAPVGFFNSTYGHPKYLEEITKQRDELLAALEKLTDVFANIGITSGLYDDEQDALKAACDAIASVKGEQ